MATETTDDIFDSMDRAEEREAMDWSEETRALIVGETTPLSEIKFAEQGRAAWCQGKCACGLVVRIGACLDVGMVNVYCPTCGTHCAQSGRE